MNPMISNRSLKFTRGFTLIELMIIVAIVGILAAIAYPNYSESVLKGRRAEARTALLDLMQQQERYFTQNGRYLAFTNVSGTVPSNTPFKTYSGENPTAGHYWLSAALCAAPLDAANTCINLSAEPKTSDIGAGTLTLDSTGNKSCSVTDKSKCWK